MLCSSVRQVAITPCEIMYGLRKRSSHIPEDDMLFALKPGAVRIGKNGAPWVTPDGVAIDETWQPSDGIVPLGSALYPYSEAHIDYSGQYAFAPESPIETGIWCVMPIQRLDHFGFSGGFYNSNRQGLKDFYADHFAMIEGLD